MKKRLLPLLLTLTMLAGLLSLPASAKSNTSEAEMIQAVNALGIMVGDSWGNMNLDSIVNRAEFTTMAVKATPGGDRVGSASSSPYPDVPYTHWAAGYVEAGVKAGYISGYTDGTFRPGNKITLAEGVSIVLKVLGYTASDFTGVYPSGQMALCRSLELDTGLSSMDPSGLLTRRDAMILFYNMLTAQTKTGQIHLTTLGYPLNATGDVDLVALINTSMQGPIVAATGWQEKIPFDVASAKVYIAREKATLGQIQANDIVYWSDSMRSLWVYRDRVTGTIQALAPNESNPTSVTVAGRTYAIETSAAAYALSNLGSYGLGDGVTLLLGRDGGVAGVVGASVVGSTNDVIGVVQAVSKEEHSSASGNYTAETVVVMATDGNTYTYTTKNANLTPGSVVQVRVESDGTVTVVRAGTGSGLSGRVSDDGKKIGNYTLAENVQILDTYENTGMRIYPSRLQGVTLKSSDVRYFLTNSKGEVSHIVLKDYTGDLHQYGIITSVQDFSTAATTGASYELVLNGKEASVVSQNTVYQAGRGPAQIQGNLMQPDKMFSLNQVVIDRIDGYTAISGASSYTIWENVSVYTYENGQYYLTELKNIQGTSYELKAYWDKAEADGGLIRILIVEPSK